MKRPILIITPGYAAPSDPACLPGLRDMVRALTKTRDVTILAARYPHQAGEYALDDAHIVALGGANATGWARWQLLARASAVATDLVVRSQTEVVHAFWADEPGWIGSVVKARTGAALVVSLGGGEIAALPSSGFGVDLQTIGPVLVGAALANADVVTCGSPWLARQLASHRWSTCAPTPLVAPLGVDLTVFQASHEAPKTSKIRAGSDVVVHVANLAGVKGHVDLLKAWPAVSRRFPAAQLVLVGAETDRLIDLPAGVAGLGEIAHAKLPEQLRDAAVWVQASRWESQSVALIEAAACGLRIVGTNVGLLADWPGAHVCRPGDVEGLADVICSGLLDAQRGVNADHRHALGAYSLDAAASRWSSVYTAAIAGAAALATGQQDRYRAAHDRTATRA